MKTPPRTLLAAVALIGLISGCARLPGGAEATPTAGASTTASKPAETPTPSAAASSASAASSSASGKQSASGTPGKASVPAGSRLASAPTQGLAFAVPQSWVIVTTQDSSQVDAYAKAIGKPSSTVTDMLTRNDLMATATKANDSFTQNIMVPLGTMPSMPDQEQALEIVTPQGPSATMTSFTDGPTSPLGPTKVARYTIQRKTGTLAHGALGFVEMNGKTVLLVTTSASESDTAKVIETALSTARAA